jgi:hypothetical protein
MHEADADIFAAVVRVNAIKRNNWRGSESLVIHTAEFASASAVLAVTCPGSMSCIHNLNESIGYAFCSPSLHEVKTSKGVII